MGSRIEYLDDLSFDLETIGDVHHIPKHLSDLLRHRCLPIAGGTVEQDRAAGIDRRPDFLDEILGNHQIGECTIDRGAIDAFVDDALALDTLAISFQRYRRRTDILAERQCILRPLLALFGQRIAQF